MHFSKKDIFTIPNIMSYFRILLVPVFCVLYLKADTLTEHILAIAVIALSAITDVLDGIVARKTGQITDMGKILDPIADKAMQFAMLFCVVTRYHRLIILIIIFAVKELVSLAFSGYLFAHKKNIGGAMWCGKVCTVVFYAIMFVFIIFPQVDPELSALLIGFSAAFMLLAFVVYMNAYIHLLIELRKEQKEEQK